MGEISAKEAKAVSLKLIKPAKLGGCTYLTIFNAWFILLWIGFLENRALSRVRFYSLRYMGVVVFLAAMLAGMHAPPASADWLANGVKIKKLNAGGNGSIPVYEREGKQLFKPSLFTQNIRTMPKSMKDYRVVGISATDAKGGDIFVKLEHPDMKTPIWVHQRAVTFANDKAWRQALARVRKIGELCEIKAQRASKTTRPQISKGMVNAFCSS